MHPEVLPKHDLQQYPAVWRIDYTHHSVLPELVLKLPLLSRTHLEKAALAKSVWQRIALSLCFILIPAAKELNLSARMQKNQQCIASTLSRNAPR